MFIDQVPLIDEFFEEDAKFEATSGHFMIVLDARRTPIGPFAGDAEAAKVYVSQDQRLDT